MELDGTYVFRRTLWNNSNCPTEEAIGEVYPGQIVDFYIYKCSEALKSSLAVPSSVMVRKTSGVSENVPLVYHGTYFGNSSYFYSQSLGENSSVEWDVYVTKNASNPSRFGIWPGKKSGVSAYRLDVVVNTGHGSFPLTQDFTFVTPKLYVKLPMRTNCTIQYREPESILGVASSCKLQYATYPQLSGGEYGVVTMLTTEGLGGRQTMFSEDGQSLDVYNQNTQGTLYTLDDQLNILSKIDSPHVSAVNNTYPVVVGEVIFELSFSLSAFVDKFVANHFSKSCDVLSDKSLLLVLNKYTVFSAVFIPYFMFGFGNNFVPLFGVSPKITLSQELKFINTEPVTSGGVKFELIESAINDITSPTWYTYLPNALSFEGYFKKEEMDIEGDEEWYTCPIKSHDYVEILSSIEFI